MSLSIYEASVPVFAKSLTTLPLGWTRRWQKAGVRER
jgi:hypothetical protein